MKNLLSSVFYSIKMGFIRKIVQYVLTCMLCTLHNKNMYVSYLPTYSYMT